MKWLNARRASAGQNAGDTERSPLVRLPVDQRSSPVLTGTGPLFALERPVDAVGQSVPRRRLVSADQRS